MIPSEIQSIKCGDPRRHLGPVTFHELFQEI